MFVCLTVVVCLCCGCVSVLWLCDRQIGRPLYTQDSVHPDGGGLGRQQSQTVLLVDEVREVDGGTYTCTAQNLQGSRTTSTTIKVLAAAAKDKVKVKPKPKKP